MTGCSKAAYRRARNSARCAGPVTGRCPKRFPAMLRVTWLSPTITGALSGWRSIRCVPRRTSAVPGGARADGKLNPWHQRRGAVVRRYPICVNLPAIRSRPALPAMTSSSALVVCPYFCSLIVRLCQLTRAGWKCLGGCRDVQQLVLGGHRGASVSSRPQVEMTPLAKSFGPGVYAPDSTKSGCPRRKFSPPSRRNRLPSVQFIISLVSRHHGWPG